MSGFLARETLFLSLDGLGHLSNTHEMFLKGCVPALYNGNSSLDRIHARDIDAKPTFAALPSAGSGHRK